MFAPLTLKRALTGLLVAAAAAGAAACGTDITGPKHGGPLGINPKEGGPAGINPREGGPNGLNPRIASDHAPTAQYGLGYDMSLHAQGGGGGLRPLGGGGGIKPLGGGAGGLHP